MASGNVAGNLGEKLIGQVHDASGSKGVLAEYGEEGHDVDLCNTRWVLFGE